MRLGRTTVGHPVDVASGTVYSTHADIAVPGKVELVWQRRYSTALLDLPPGSLGPGWTTSYFATLTREQAGFRFFTPEGDLDWFADPSGAIERGAIVRNLSTFQELQKVGSHFIVTRWDQQIHSIERYVFRNDPARRALLLASLEDITGDGLDMVRDTDGRLLHVRQRREGRTLTLTYTPQARVESVSFLQRTRGPQTLLRLEYDNQGRLSAAYDALGHADHYEYDRTHRITREITKDGGVFSFTYDDQGRCVKTSGLDRYDEKRLHYMDAVHWTEVTDSLGHVTLYQWAPSGQVVCEIGPLGATRRSKYDENGRLITMVAPTGAAVAFDYDDAGNCCKMTDPFGNTLQFTFNAAHQPVSLTDQYGGIWRREYDAHNRLVRTADPDGFGWALSYDSRGNLVKVIDPMGTITRQMFSETGTVRQVIDTSGNQKDYVHNEFGRLIEEKGPTGATLRFHYNLRGDLVKLEWPNGSLVTFEHGPGGALTAVTDATRKRTTHHFGPCRRRLQTTDPAGNITQYHWGSEPRRLQAITNPKGETYRFFYDAAGKLIGEVGFDGRELVYEYDAQGTWVRTVNGQGEAVAYTRDLMNRATAFEFSDGRKLSFVYDPGGRMVSATSADCALRFEYDVHGRIVREWQNDYLIETDFDLLGRPIQTRCSLGPRLAYSYSTQGWLERVTVGDRAVIECERNGAGHEICRKLAGDLLLRQDYDLRGRLLRQELVRGMHAPGAPTTASGAQAFSRNHSLVERIYQYDAGGTLVSTRNQDCGERVYVYDPAARLLQVNSGGQTLEQFAYDPTGNLTLIGKGGDHQVLAYGPGDRLLARGDVKYSYDGNGRLVCKAVPVEGDQQRVWQFRWDVQNQLRQVVLPDCKTYHYSYDALGRRVAKVGPEGKSEFIWWGDAILHEVVKKAARVTWVPDVHGFTPLCKLTGGKVYAVISDQLGVPRELVDQHGHVVWRANYLAWGAAEITDTAGVDCPARFPGQWFDAESQLHYNRFRYYDPAIGRFISPDPTRLMGGINQYAYAANPVNWIDPFGLQGGGAGGGGCFDTDITDDEIDAAFAGATRGTMFELPGQSPTNPQIGLTRVRIGGDETHAIAHHDNLTFGGIQGAPGPGGRVDVRRHSANPNAPAGSYSQTHPTTQVNNHQHPAQYRLPDGSYRTIAAMTPEERAAAHNE
jgi:RHS repeat-associated protein